MNLTSIVGLRKLISQILSLFVIYFPHINKGYDKVQK